MSEQPWFPRYASPWPDRAYLRELIRPWKLLTWAIGMGWLLYGAIYYQIGDWDIGVCLIMGTLTYLGAPWSVQVIAAALRFRPRGAWWHIAVALLYAWFVVDLSYLGWHHWMGNPIDREGNARASAALYGLAGMGWSWRGSLASLYAATRRALS